jgi:hypothetical protein
LSSFLACSEYATQQQLTALAEAVKNSLKAALSAQAKRIADTEEKRSELCVATKGWIACLTSLALHRQNDCMLVIACWLSLR